ncbi:hypothetical protein V9T40_004022 [Parthenolecanium corni]|uniref:Serrate RNA effector molecule homolog n=1 Tax=Parthenolecanium corni TaxID=536013 RepID=A0AAN9Y311_9HEMI
MADSDDEYDKKFRDKFRGERDRADSTKGFDNRRDERRPPRDDWIERDAWAARSRGRGDFRNMMRERHSPVRHDSAPPMKRMRNDWDDRRFFDPPGFPYSSWLSAESQAPPSPRVPPASAPAPEPSIESQPPMMSLKAFINTLDDNVSDDEALKKYNEYKMEFRRQQLNEFFVAHKDEEWFKEKYHPVVSTKRKEEHLKNIKTRVEVFTDMLEKGRFDDILVDADQSDLLIKTMDMFVILLEGGNENDFRILDANDGEIKPAKVGTGIETKADDSKNITTKINNNDSKKRDSDSAGKVDNEEIYDHTVTTTQEDDKEEKAKKSEEKEEGEEEGEKVDEKKQENDDEADVIDGEAKALTEKSVEETNSDPPKAEVPEVKPRPLHKTFSIFLRNLAPTVTREEIENICKKFPGFLRVAIADPQPERRWFRRGWVTFERDVDIKMIYWHITNLRDIELSPIVNRDLTRRVRTVSPYTNNKRVLRNDMKLCAKIISNLDKKFGLWVDSTAPEEEPFELLSKNPVLKNITTYLIEEASAEEEELLGQNEPTEETDEKDPHVYKVLDKMLLYLRFVHSVDYYNHCEYPNEDEMPNRCGIIHARVTSSTNKVSVDEVTEYCKTFQSKLSHLIDPPSELTTEDIAQLGMKNADVEVDKFISANTQELGPQKWLCPLSGKKFKGPEFVLKHIQNKHAEKIEEVRLEVEYFNNYLRDSKRPQLPEHPVNKQPKPEPVLPNSVLPPAHPNPYPYNFSGGMFGGGFNRGINYGYSRGPRPTYGGRGRGMEHRPIIHYRDLDAPKEPDEFI